MIKQKSFCVSHHKDLLLEKKYCYSLVVKYGISERLHTFSFLVCFCLFCWLFFFFSFFVYKSNFVKAIFHLSFVFHSYQFHKLLAKKCWQRSTCLCNLSSQLMHILQLQAWKDEEATVRRNRRAFQIHYAAYMLSGDMFLHAPVGHIGATETQSFPSALVCDWV